MPRPKPLVALHGAVNFDRLVPFDSKASSPPLANNDILVMRRAAGGDNLTLSISDINATGSVNIAQLLGGVNTDMLYRVGGVWTGTGPTGLSYDGAMLTLDGDDLTIEGGGNIEVQDAGDIEITGSGNLEISGPGGIEINGGGGIMIIADGNIELDSADGQLILTGGAEMLFEGGSGITLENGAAIAFDGDGDIDFDGNSGNILMGDGQIRADQGTEALPSITFQGDIDTGIFNTSPDHFSLVAGGQQVARVREVGNVQFQLKPQSSFQNSPGEPLLQFHNSALGFYTPIANVISLTVSGVRSWDFTGGSIEANGGGGAGPALLNVSASPSVPTIIPNKADPDTGLTRDNLNGCALVGGGLACIRARNIGGAEAVGFYTTNAIIKQTGVAVTAAAIHTACVNLGLFSA